MKRLLGVTALLGICPAAYAETLNVAGFYEAGAKIDRRVQTIVVDDFGGDAGMDLSFLVTDALASVEVNGQQWYSIIPASLFDRYRSTSTGSYGAGIDEAATENGALASVAALQGTAHTQINEYSTDPKEVEECTKKVDGDCVKKETVTYECRVLTVGYSPSVRLTATDGSLLYQDSRYLDADHIYCLDKEDSPDPYEMLASLAEQYSYSVRLDLAPHYRDEELRILERRKGMSKPDARSFKQAVRLTKTDPYSACLAFGELEASNQEHVSVLFNIGLCHESEGELENAREHYLRAIAIDPDKHQVKAGLNRVASRLSARRQIADHLIAT